MSHVSVTRAGFGMLQGKLVTLNKGLLYLDGIFLSPWLLILIINQISTEISHCKEEVVGFFFAKVIPLFVVMIHV